MVSNRHRLFFCWCFIVSICCFSSNVSIGQTNCAWTETDVENALTYLSGINDNTEAINLNTDTLESIGNDLKTYTDTIESKLMTIDGKLNVITTNECVSWTRQDNRMLTQINFLSNLVTDVQALAFGVSNNFISITNDSDIVCMTITNIDGRIQTIVSNMNSISEQFLDGDLGDDFRTYFAEAVEDIRDDLATLESVMGGVGVDVSVSISALSNAFVSVTSSVDGLLPYLSQIEDHSGNIQQALTHDYDMNIAEPIWHMYGYFPDWSTTFNGILEHVSTLENNLTDLNDKINTEGSISDDGNYSIIVESDEVEEEEYTEVASTVEETGESIKSSTNSLYWYSGSYLWSQFVTAFTNNFALSLPDIGQDYDWSVTAAVPEQWFG